MKKIYLTTLLRKGYVVLEEGKNKINNEQTIEAVLQSFYSLGFSLDDDSVIKLGKANEDALIRFYNTNVEIMKEAKGDNVKHIIFYPNFPHIEHLEENEYLFRAVFHYLTASKMNQGFMNGDIEIIEREEIHNDHFDCLKIINVSEAEKILINLANDLFEQKTSLSYTYYDFLDSMFIDYPNQISPSEIPFKENIAKYVRFLIEDKEGKYGDMLNRRKLRFLSNATDLLRVYAVISGCSETLKCKVKFVSLDRKCRRLFLSILEDMASSEQSLIEDLVRHEFLYKKAFEKLHVGEYANEFPKIYNVASKFRNDDYQTYYSKLVELKDNQEDLLKLLSSRPGEFGRRLDSLLRNPNFDIDMTLKSFRKIASKISSVVLMQLWEFYKNRNLYPTRVFCVKGAYRDLYYEEEDNRIVLDEKIVNKVILVIEDSLRSIYNSYPRVEKVYLSDTLKNYAVAMNARNSSSGHHTLTFGTRVKLDEENGSYLRFFTHWKNDDCRVDIDLSLELVDESFEKITSVSWHNMDGGKNIDTYHSGDIVTAPEGASEFVDFNYIEAKKDYRYAVVTNSVFTGQEFALIPECFSGVMFMPKKGKEGEVFNPEFVKYKYDLTQVGANQNIAFAIDLETMEMIWMDVPLFHCSLGIVASQSSNIIMALKNALKTHMDVYSFMRLHSGHVSFVDREEALVVFSDEDDATIKPYEIEKISSKWY